MNQRTNPGRSVATIALWCAAALGFTSAMLLAGYLLGVGVSTRAAAEQAAGSFFDSATPPVWIILFLNVASFLGAVTAAYAAIKITPQTSLKVADIQVGVTREAIAVAASSADAASSSAKAANRSSDNQGIHAVARLRQEWINELRGRVAEAHALLGNWRKLDAAAGADQKHLLDERVIKTNEVMARIELLLNPKEKPSQALLKALRDLEDAGGDLESRRALSPSVIAAAQKVLKKEWDRVRKELHGYTSPAPKSSGEPSTD